MRVQDKDKFVFTKNVAVMLTSGIPLREAIQSQVAHAGSPFFKGILARIIQDIETGQRFSFALSRHPSVFEPFYVNVVSAGEKAGSLEQNLEYIAAQLEARAAFKKALNSALMYPAVLLIAVCGVGFVFAYFVLPTLGDLLSSFQAEPPFATKIILFISVAASDYGPLIFAGVVLAFVFLYFFTRTEKGKSTLERFLLHLPVLGNIFRQAQLVEVATILSTLLKSGVPVHESLQITAQSVSNIVYKEAVARIVSPVLKGNTVSAFLDKRLFPPLFIQMVQVGEKSARMEQNLDFLAAFYQKEVQYRIKNILTLLEPFLLIIVGIAVLLLALAVLGPIYQIAGS